MFIPHLNVTIKRLTRYEQKVVLAAMLEGKSMPSNMAANTNHATLLKNQSTIKYHPSTRFLSNFGCKIIFMCSINFWHQQDSNLLLKEALVMWPLSANGLLGLFYGLNTTNHVPRLSLRCLPWSLEERPWLQLVTWPPKIWVVEESVWWEGWQSVSKLWAVT